MKLISVTLVLTVCTAFGSEAGTQLNFRNVPDHARKEFQTIIAEQISDVFIWKLAQKASPRDPVLPCFPEVIPIDNVELNLDDLGLTDLIGGNVSLRNGGASGLHTIIDDLRIALTVPASITYEFASGEMKVYGDYNANALIALTENITISGAGNLTASIDNLGLSVNVRALVNLITNKITVQSVAIDVGFDSVVLYAEDLAINDVNIDWDSVNEDAKPVFDEFWVESKATIEELVKDLLAELLKDCRITDLIGGDFSCIGLGSTPGSRSSKKDMAPHLLTAAINYFAPIIPNLLCELPSTGDPSLTTPIVDPEPTTPTTTTPTTTTPTTTTLATTTSEDNAAVSYNQAAAGTLLMTLLVTIANIL